MKKSKTIDVTKAKSSQLKAVQELSAIVKWSKLRSIQEWARIYGIHRDTMRKLLKNNVICNQQLTPRLWRIATYELPEGFEEK